MDMIYCVQSITTRKSCHNTEFCNYYHAYVNRRRIECVLVCLWVILPLYRHTFNEFLCTCSEGVLCLYLVGHYSEFETEH